MGGNDAEIACIATSTCFRFLRRYRPRSVTSAGLRRARRVPHPPSCVGSPLHAGVSLVIGARQAADMAIDLFILLEERTFADALAIRLEREPDMEVVAARDTSALPSRMLVGSRVDVVLLDADLADNAAFRLGQELSTPPSRRAWSFSVTPTTQNASCARSG